MTQNGFVQTRTVTTKFYGRKIEMYQGKMSCLQLNVQICFLFRNSCTLEIKSSLSLVLKEGKKELCALERGGRAEKFRVWTKMKINCIAPDLNFLSLSADYRHDTHAHTNFEWPYGHRNIILHRWFLVY